MRELTLYVGCDQYPSDETEERNRRPWTGESVTFASFTPRSGALSTLLNYLWLPFHQKSLLIVLIKQRGRWSEARTERNVWVESDNLFSTSSYSSYMHTFRDACAYYWLWIRACSRAIWISGPDREGDHRSRSPRMESSEKGGFDGVGLDGDGEGAAGGRTGG